MTDFKTAPTASTPRRGLRIALWIAQVLLAALFLMAGGMKLTSPIEQLQAQMAWVGGAMGPAVRFIGLMELLGGLGLLLPAAVRILPILTGLAALGLVAMMTLATLTHITRGEAVMVPITLTLGSVAAFIAWGRLVAAPIAARR